ncbi:MAG TPA: PQQ-dependent sugar dehydrogenase [Gemmataceae bacterium]|nr:PQQ-dependent sugar dehydrogenase [Gemmataceae bacterium]
MPQLRHCPALRLQSLETRETPTTLPAGFSETRVTTNATLTNPTAMEFSPDGQLWVLEQGGRVKVIRADGSAHIAATLSVDSQGERGLLGIAFAPDYDGAGPNVDRVYLYYTEPANSPDLANNRLTRFTVTGAGTDTPTVAGQEILRELPPNTEDNDTNHNGGAIHFGPDGKLYVAVGDHNYDTLPQSAHVSQILTTPFGKMLRLNPDGTNPADNPFFTGGATDWRGAIWALGLRNPYTFAIQPATGRVFINDVGEGSWEEINDGIAGANYGWAGSNAPLWEGFESPPPSWANYHDPIMAYDHSNSAPTPAGIAITGGTFYPGNGPFGSDYAGKYFFADLGGNFIRLFDPANPGTVGTPDKSTGFASALTGTQPVDLKVDAAGNLYYLSRGAGAVYRISFRVPTIVHQPADVQVNVGQPASLIVQATGAQPLTFQWQKLVGATWTNVGAATAATFTIPSTAAGDAGQYRVVVSNSSGTATSDPATLTVNELPVVTITAPDNYSFGQTINFSGSANDPEDGTLPSSTFTWRVDFVHGGLTQNVVPTFTGQAGGSFVANVNRTDPNQLYRIVLIVTDSDGGTTTLTRDVLPQLARITLASQPAGAALTLDGKSAGGPVVSVSGMPRTLRAPIAATIGDYPYRFAGWSDGGTAMHTITPGGDTDYVANYARVTPGLQAEYFDFTTPLSVVPDLSGRTPDLTRTDPRLIYTASSLPWPGLGDAFADTFAARFTGFLKIDTPGRYTLTARSGDGSMVWLDGELIIDNDGVHEMRSQSAARTLSAGYHALRVEYFENTGTAGLVLKWAGPGFASQTIPARRLFRDAPAGSLAFRQDTGPDGLVVMEAENHDGNVLRSGKLWRAGSTPAGFAGTGVEVAAPNTGTAFATGFVARSPRLDYRVYFETAGTHYVWVRGRAGTTADNSLHVGLDGSAVATSDRITGLKPAYRWTQTTIGGPVATVNVSSPGIHTVNVWMAKDGAVIDRLLLTTSPDFVPTGLGPAESPHTAAAIDHSGGFAGASGLQFNGSAGIVGATARLTDATMQAGSMFASGQVNVGRFATTFDFRLTSALTNGFAFVIQGGASTALGAGGSGLGYEGIGNSVAVKFDLIDDPVGSSTGLYTNGQSPTTGGIDLVPIDLHSGHTFRASIEYTGGTIQVSIRDLTTGAMASQSYAVDIPTLVGGPSAFVGFTGATGTLSAVQDIVNWAYWN